MEKQITDFPNIPNIEIKKKVGSGGMSDVFLGIQTKLHREVAVKFLKSELSRGKGFAERFQSEARTAAKLNHPNILTIYDVNEYDGGHYIVMELLQSSLYDKISGGEKLSTDYILTISIQLAAALMYAHQKGVIHRDIKSDNIMFRQDNTPVLVDFGIARAVHSEKRITKTGSIIGTPFYMSPEQCQGEDVDWRSDIYSFGVVIFEMLCGKVPYDADNASGVLIKHIKEKIPVLPNEIRQFQPLINNMLSKKKENRYLDESKLITDLQELKTNQSTSQPDNMRDTNVRLEQTVEPKSLKRNSDPEGWVFQDEDELELNKEQKSVAKEQSGKKSRIFFHIFLIFMLLLSSSFFIFKRVLGSPLQKVLSGIFVKETIDPDPEKTKKIMERHLWLIGSGKNQVKKINNQLINEFSLSTKPNLERGRLPGDFLPSLSLNAKNLNNLPVLKTPQEQKKIYDLLIKIRKELDKNQLKEAKLNLKKLGELEKNKEYNQLVKEIEFEERKKKNERDDLKAYKGAVGENTVAAYSNYLKKWPKGIKKREALSRIQKLNKDKKDFDIYQRALKNDNLETYREYLQKFPKGLYKQKVEVKIQTIVNQKVKDVNNRLSVTAVKFFTSTKKNSANEKVKYLNEFDRSNLKYVFSEVEFQNNLYTIDTVTTPIKIVYKHKTLDFSSQSRGEVLQEKQSVKILYRRGMGWERPGKWLAGEYTVKIFIEDFLIYSGQFSVLK